MNKRKQPIVTSFKSTKPFPGQNPKKKIHVIIKKPKEKEKELEKESEKVIKENESEKDSEFAQFVQSDANIVYMQNQMLELMKATLTPKEMIELMKQAFGSKIISMFAKIQQTLTNVGRKSEEQNSDLRKKIDDLNAELEQLKETIEKKEKEPKYIDQTVNSPPMYSNDDFSNFNLEDMGLESFEFN